MVDCNLFLKFKRKGYSIVEQGITVSWLIDVFVSVVWFDIEKFDKQTSDIINIVSDFKRNKSVWGFPMKSSMDDILVTISCFTQ